MELKRYQLPHRLFFTVLVGTAAAMGSEWPWYGLLPICVAIFLFTFVAYPPLDKGRERPSIDDTQTPRDKG